MRKCGVPEGNRKRASGLLQTGIEQQLLLTEARPLMIGWCAKSYGWTEWGPLSPRRVVGNLRAGREGGQSRQWQAGAPGN